MIRAGFSPKPVSYLSLIDACIKASEPRRANCWLEKMIEAGVPAKKGTILEVVRALAASGNTLTAERWLSHMTGSGLRPDQETLSIVEAGYKEQGRPDLAAALHGRRDAKEFQPKCSRSELIACR